MLATKSLAAALQYEAWRKHEEAKARAARQVSRERAPREAANWTSTPAAAQSEATQPVPVPAAAARPVETGLQALIAAFE